MEDDIENAQIKIAIRSDHSAISLNVNSLKELPFGPSYWKFNPNLLEDETYVHLINSKYPEWLAEFSDVLDKRYLWDLVKYRIRQVTIKYSKEKARKRRVSYQRLNTNYGNVRINAIYPPPLKIFRS